MGRDMIISVIDSKGNYVKRDFCDFRNGDWFDKIMDEEYEYSRLPLEYGIPANAPSEIKRDYEDTASGCYHFSFLTVKQYKDWYHKYLPMNKAGWVTRYTAWLYHSKRIVPSPTQVCTYYPGERGDSDLPQEYMFITFEDMGDSSVWLFEQVEHCADDDYIVWYFNR